MAVIVMSVQSIVGVVIQVTTASLIYLQLQLSQACMAGIVFAKFTKPTGRAETLMFSKNALITLRNGSLFLLVRLADIR
jgi:potassium inwardly-rectifying channel subfamily J